MNLEAVKQFMKEVGWGSFATTDGAKVGVRPMGGWAWIGNELWCATGTSSDKVAQLRKVPHAEFCFVSPQHEHVRISGSCTISTNNEDKMKLYEANPILKEHIEDPKSPEYVVIRMKPDRIRMMSTDELTYKDVKLP
jgi:general stress protein 26